ncbi:putative RNA helicase armi [Melipona quadrifasciata]|uniref:RNA helicase n=1 Tax=Melipona quadrifasciata TaxID=166423 RepID=A0A0N0U411_9HYME|nr:putative RNA helicase armi [Melipona quadrifasciata]
MLSFIRTLIKYTIGYKSSSKDESDEINSVITRIENAYEEEIRKSECFNEDTSDKVCYSLSMKRDNHEQKHKIKIISVINESWDDDAENSDVDIVKPQTLTRCIVGKVMERKNRLLIIEPSNVTVDLNKVESEFIPVIGDWLQLETEVEIDEVSYNLNGEILEIKKIQPLRSRLDVGTVTSFDLTKEIGVIGKDTVFNKRICESGYIPCVGDKVISDSIESDQGFYTWRSLTVVPVLQVSKEVKLPVLHNISYASKKDLNDLMKNKHGIVISDDLNIDLNVQETKNITITINNLSNTTHVLRRSCFMIKKSNSQLTLVEPSVPNIVSILNPSDKLTYVFKCTATFIDLDEWNEATYIPGIRPCRPPSFIKVRNMVYKVPKHYWDIISKCINERKSQTECKYDIENVVPCLSKRLSFESYKDRFHALLYLEEIAQIVNMQQYNINSTVMRHCGEYLVMEVPGLAEKRPSLLIGDRAIVSFKWDNSQGKLKYEGFIHKVTNLEIFLKFNCKFHQEYNYEDCQVTFKCSQSVIQRCHNAIDMAVGRLGQNFLFPTHVIEKESQLELEEIEAKDTSVYKQLTSQWTDSMDSESSASTSIIIQDSKEISISSCNIELQPVISQVRKRKLLWFNKDLNYYQKEAVKNILKGHARPLPYVIFGPPGTGKTVTLCETVLQILSTVPESRCLLIATPSNSSANLISERLLDSGILKPGDMVRLIAYHCLNNDSIPSKLLPYCATAELADETTIEKLKYNEVGPKLNCTMSVLGRHRITIGTCVALGILNNMGFPRGHFSHVLVDEAGQATEPEIMIPLNFIHSDYGQVILSGDPLQLGPVVESGIAKNFGLDESFLSRLLRHFPYQKDSNGFETCYDPRLVTKLLINYRSLPEILELSSSLFYDSELKAQISSKTSKEAKLLQTLATELPKRKDIPPAIIFHGVNGGNCKDNDSPSWYNPEEATQVYLYLLKLYKCGLSPDDIGIITPYQKQVLQIRELLMELDVELPKISSVEGFQGQERNVIIISTVRSSSNFINEDIKHSLGFVACPRRLNVAITRGRALVIILGNPILLVQDPYWRSVLIYCINQDSYTGCSFGFPDIENSCIEENDSFVSDKINNSR